MKQNLRPIFLNTVSAIVLALVYNLAAGLIISSSTNWRGIDFGAMYIDVAFYLVFIFLLSRLRKQRPAERNASGPVGVLFQRLLILAIPIVLLVRVSIILKVSTHQWYSFISFNQIGSYTAVALILVLVYIGLDMGYELMEKWRKSEAEAEKLHRLHTQAQLENLKAQVNPHFLFNSLNTLSSLIVEDENRARQFVRQLSAVYRYILENRENDLVPLDNEIKLFDAYVYLCETRFEENFRVHQEWPTKPNDWLIPPMTLQILVENAIKHNAISKQKPLDLWVMTEGDKLLVGNTNQPKRQLEDSTGIGLANLKERYKQLANSTIQVDSNSTEFVVTLPLIKK